MRRAAAFYPDREKGDPTQHTHNKTQVKKLHPYDEPEVVSLPITGGSASYLQWLHSSTEGADPSQLPDKLG